METNSIVVRRASEGDIPAMTEVNMECFHGDRGSPVSATKWLMCRVKSFPLYQLFVIEVGGKVAGYVGWEIHGGFLRTEPVVELEQIGILEQERNLKLGSQLQEESLRAITDWVKENNPRIESSVSFVVWVYAHNLRAINIYLKVFTDGIVGMRTQYGNRSEVMLRHRVPLVVGVPKEER